MRFPPGWRQYSCAGRFGHGSRALGWRVNGARGAAGRQMLARSIALAALLGVAAPARADPAASTPCELERADRTRTPSSRCLSCHDGTAAPGLGESHPVEVDYARAAL